MVVNPQKTYSFHWGRFPYRWKTAIWCLREICIYLFTFDFM